MEYFLNDWLHYDVSYIIILCVDAMTNQVVKNYPTKNTYLARQNKQNQNTNLNDSIGRNIHTLNIYEMR